MLISNKESLNIYNTTISYNNNTINKKRGNIANYINIYYISKV
jgi:hypothetical protein